MFWENGHAVVKLAPQQKFSESMRTPKCVCLIPQSAQRTRPLNFSLTRRKQSAVRACAFRAHLYFIIFLFTRPHNLDLFMKCYETVCWLRSFLSRTKQYEKNISRFSFGAACAAWTQKRRRRRRGHLHGGLAASVGSSAKRRIARGATICTCPISGAEIEMRLREMLLPCARSVTTILECDDNELIRTCEWIGKKLFANNNKLNATIKTLPWNDQDICNAVSLLSGKLNLFRAKTN